MRHSSRIAVLSLLILVVGSLFACSSGVSGDKQSLVTSGSLTEDKQASPSPALLEACEEQWASAQDPSSDRWAYRRPLTQLSQPPAEETPCWTWDDERHLFTPTRPGWLRYTNERFGFSVEVPADWYEVCPPINGDGLAIDSPDGLAQIIFYGFNNVMEGSNAEGLQTLDEYTGGKGQPIMVDGYVGREVPPTPGGADGCYKRRWIVLLGLLSGRGILLIAPPHLFDRYNAVLDEMLKTYRAGDMDDL
jgi:hypothetical protein